MKNREVIDAFFEDVNCHTVHLRSRDGKLFSYNTIIAEKDGEFLYVNITKYSPTTSRHQNNVLRKANEYFNSKKIITFNDVERGTQNLQRI